MMTKLKHRFYFLGHILDNSDLLLVSVCVLELNKSPGSQGALGI